MSEATKESREASVLANVMPPSTTTIGNRVAKGVVWIFGQLMISRIIQFGSQIALAWLLSPKDFGVIGLTFTITSVVGAIFSFGIEDVLLQRQKRLRLWSSQAFWFSLVSAFAAAAIVLTISPIAAKAYHTPQITSLTLIAVLSMLLSALVTVPSAIIRADLKFHAIAAIAIGETLTLQVLTLAFAYFGFAVYSFVLPLPIIALGKAMIFWYLAGPVAIGRPRFSTWKFLAANASALTGVNLITALVHQGDYVVLGLMASNTAVGLYYFAYRVAIQPLQLLAGSLSNVLFPALSQFQRDATRQRISSLKACEAVSLIVTPACYLQAALAEPIISLLFPQRWSEAVPLVQILSCGLAFDAVSWAAGPLLHARGEFKRSLFYSMVTAPIFFAFVTVGAWFATAKGVSIGVALFYVVVGPIYTYRVFRPTGVTVSKIVGIYVIPNILSVAIVGGTSFIANQLVSGPVFQSLVVVAFAVPIYILSVWHFRPVVCRELVARFSELAFRSTSRVELDNNPASK